MIKKSLCLMLLFCTALCHVGCGDGKKESAYRAFCAAYEGEARWEINGAAYAGQLSIGVGNSPAERGATILYTAPASLTGLQVAACEEGVRLTLEGNTHLLAGKAAEQFLAIFRLFVPVSAIADATGALCYIEGQERYTIRLGSANTVQEICYSSPTLTIYLWPGGES